MNHFKMQPATCPHCGFKMDCATALGEKSSPEPGDVTICIECVRPLVFGPKMNLQRPSLRDSLGWTEAVRKKLREAQFILRQEKDPKAIAYKAQILGMAKKLREWRKNNPDKRPIIQYNTQPRVGVIAALDQAIDKHFISLNPDAEVMLSACCDLREHTIFMLKAALEISSKKEE